MSQRRSSVSIPRMGRGRSGNATIPVGVDFFLDAGLGCNSAAVQQWEMVRKVWWGGGVGN